MSEKLLKIEPPPPPPKKKDTSFQEFNEYPTNINYDAMFNPFAPSGHIWILLINGGPLRP